MPSRSEIQILVNGEPNTVSETQTVADLLESLNLKPRLVAVERNEELVPRAVHSECWLKSGDRIEIVTLVGGG